MRTRQALLALAMTIAACEPLFAQPDLHTSALVGMARTKRDVGDLAGSATFWEEARAAHALNASELTGFLVLTMTDGKDGPAGGARGPSHDTKC